MNINELTIGDAQKIAAIFNATKVAQEDHPYKIGEIYQIRTVTMGYVGRLKSVHQQELVLEDAAWIPDFGRWQQACETGEYAEVEPFRKGQPVVIGRGTLLDAQIAPKLQLAQK